MKSLGLEHLKNPDSDLMREAERRGERGDPQILPFTSYNYCHCFAPFFVSLLGGCSLIPFRVTHNFPIQRMTIKADPLSAGRSVVPNEVLFGNRLF